LPLTCPGRKPPCARALERQPKRNKAIRKTEKRLKPLPLVITAVALISAGPPEKKSEIPPDDPNDVAVVRGCGSAKLDRNGSVIDIGIFGIQARRNTDAERALMRLRHVESVRVDGQADAVVDVLRGWTSLKDAYFSDVSDEGLVALEGLSKLRGLRIYSRQVTDIGLKSIAKLKNLESLSIDGARISDTGLKEIATLPRLKELELNRNGITDAGLTRLKGMKLESLALRGTRITDRGIDAIKNMTSLKYLEVDDTKVTRAALTKIDGIPHLKVFGLPTEEVHEVQDNQNDIAAIQAASPSISAVRDNVTDNVHQIDASCDNQPPRKWLKQLNGLHNVKELVLPDYITEDEDLAMLIALPVPGKLVVNGCEISDNGLKSIGALQGLRRLDLSGCSRITAAGMQHLSQLKELESLCLARTPLTDDSLRPLAKITKLGGLDLSHTNVTDAGLANLGHLTNLEFLDLHGTDTSDDGLLRLRGLKKLRDLYPGANVTRDGVSDLKKDLPLLNVHVH
jgi:Leucine-rich repeat (LRR) protein